MKSINYKDSLLVAALLSVGFCGAPAFADTLAEAVQETLDTSPDIRVEAAKRRAAEQGIGVARGGYYPKINLLAGVGREWTDSPTTRAAGSDGRTMNRRERQATLTQMLFDGFGVSSEVERNKAITESEAYRVAGSSEKLALNAVEAYLEVLRLRDLLTASEANLGAHEKTYEQIRMRAQSGVSKKSDQDQMEARLALAKANVLSAESDLKDAEINYLRVVGKRPVELMLPESVVEATLPPTAEEAVKLALMNHPLLKSADADVRQAQAQHDAAKQFMYPTLHLELAYNNNDNVEGVRGKNENAYAMLRMRYNLFNGFADTSLMDKTKEQFYEASEIRLRAEREAEQSILLSYTAFLTARERLPSLRQHRDSSQLTREAYAKQFSIGQRTLLDVLDGENEYFTSSVNYVNGEYVDRFARYRVLADMGALLSTLGVKPREEAQVEGSSEPREIARDQAVK